jgi:translocon-associated protein subunit beta
VNVNLVDNNFPEDSFEYASGFRTVKWAKIPAGQNVSHTAIVKPKASGMFNFTHATIAYLPSEKTDRVQVSGALMLLALK